MRNHYAVYWLLLSGAILLFDYMTGSFVSLAVLLFFPVALASWFNGKRWGLTLAIVTPLVRLTFHFVWNSPVTLADATVNALIRIATFATFAFLIDLVARQKAELRVLSGNLPTCAWCKNIRDANGRWQAIETYISQHSDAQFSHGICPECARKHFGELAEASPAASPGSYALTQSAIAKEQGITRTFLL